MFILRAGVGGNYAVFMMIQMLDAWVEVKVFESHGGQGGRG